MTETTLAPPSVEEPDDTGDADDSRKARLRPILWRLHFLGGFLAAPVALWLALTGIAYAWNPQLESWLFGDQMAASAQPSRNIEPLADQVDAALSSYPGTEVISVQTATRPGNGHDTTAVYLKPRGAVGKGFAPPPGAFTAYVDPVSAEVTGHVRKESTPDRWLRSLHSNFRLGPGIGTLTELAASWVVVALITGLYLWWPRSKRAWQRALRPRLRGLRSGGRRPWRNLHASLGVVSLVVLATIVVTGLTWTEYAGRWVDVAKDNFAGESPFLDTAIEGGSHGAHGSGSGSGSSNPADLHEIDAVVAGAQRGGLTAPLTITPATEPGSAWKVQEVDDRWPLDQTQVAVDPATGEVTDRLEFSDQTMLDKATTLGIGFHEGSLFGLPNQILLTVLALGLVVMLIAGYMTWWRRRPAGAFGAPPKMGSILRTVPVPVLVGFVLLLVLLPTLGIAFVAFLVLERILRGPRRWSMAGAGAAAGCALLVVAVTLTGCGGGDDDDATDAGPAPTQATEQQPDAVIHHLESAEQAYASGDKEGAKNHLIEANQAWTQILAGFPQDQADTIQSKLNTIAADVANTAPAPMVSQAIEDLNATLATGPS